MSKFFKGLIIFFTTLGFAISGIIIAYILLKGIPNVSPGLLALTYTSENVSLMPALITTLITIILILIFALPIGIFTAIYLSNYAKNKLLIKAVRFSTEILSSIPSIDLIRSGSSNPLNKNKLPLGNSTVKSVLFILHWSYNFQLLNVFLIKLKQLSFNVACTFLMTRHFLPGNFKYLYIIFWNTNTDFPEPTLRHRIH